MTDALAAAVAAIARLRAAEHGGGAPERRVLVGIVGPPGVGKTTFAGVLAAAVPQSAVLPMDGFHLPQARLVELGRRDRMGAPDTFDVDGFVTLLETLRAYGPAPVPAPLFDRDAEESVPHAFAIGPDIRTVLVEGNYLLHDVDGWQRVAPALDLTMFLHLDDAVRRRRLIARHIAFGKTPDAAAAWAPTSGTPWPSAQRRTGPISRSN